MASATAQVKTLSSVKLESLSKRLSIYDLETINNGNNVNNTENKNTHSLRRDYYGSLICKGKKTHKVTFIDNISNNLSIGDIYSVNNSEYLSRSIGDMPDVVGKNFAYDKQKINGYILEEQLGANLLTYQKLCEKYTYEKEIGLDEDYNYDRVKDGILPKLYNTSRTELLPNQPDIKIGMDSNLAIKENIIEKNENNSISMLLEIDNPKELLIVNFLTLVREEQEEAIK